jgi:hypothetical protein
MNTEELAELFLTYVYDLAEASPHPNFLFSVNEFAPMMGITDMSELIKAVNLLESKGLIFLASFDNWGGISAAITMEGSVFVEKGGETGIIQRYREDRNSFIHDVPLPEPQVEPPPVQQTSSSVHLPKAPETMNQDKEAPFYAGRAIDAILADIADIIDRDTSIGAEMKNDLLSDLATLRIQIDRNVKNKAVIEAILKDLAGVPSIAPLVTGLYCIVDAYFK